MKTCRHLFQSRWRGAAAVLAVLMFVVFFYPPTISIAQSSASDEGNIKLQLCKRACEPERFQHALLPLPMPTSASIRLSMYARAGSS